MSFNNLPSQPTSFVGREKELVDLAALLDDAACRLITLVGAGGIGKTRLAIQAAASQLPQFADGVVFVPLTPVATPDLLASAVAAALDISFLVSEKPPIQIIDYLREKHLLLVMDNFEHLVEASSFLVDLLQAAPLLKILVTSRERLNLQEEWVVTVDGLSYPAEASFVTLENYNAVQLFMQRARQIKNDFSLAENAAAVGTICRQVEGMPLGLELAVSWLRVMTCKQIAIQMGSNPDFLTTSLRNFPERHRSLRTVFEQSWRMLSADEQSVLLKLSVFRGGFDIEAAGPVAGATLPLLAGLADKSLIRFNGKARYDMHELLRQYAADQLSDAGLTSASVQQHIDYFLKLAERAESYLFGREQITWFDRLEVEMDNLRAVLSRSVESETGLRLAAALGWFFSERAYWNEGLNWLEQMLEANPDASAALRAKALNFAGAFAGHFKDYRRLQTYCGQALEMARKTSDDRNIAWALAHLGIFNNKVHELDQSTAFLEESVALFRQLDDRMGLAHTLLRLSWNVLDMNNIPYTCILLDEAGALASEAGDSLIAGWVAQTRGDIAYYQNDFKQAYTQYTTSLLHFQQAQFPSRIVDAFIKLARAALYMGDLNLAETHLKDALVFIRESLRNDEDWPFLLSVLATVAKEFGQFKRAAHLLAAAYDEETVYWSQQLPERYPYLNDIAAVRVHMGETAFAAAWSAGKAMTQKEAIDYALESEATPTKVLQPPHAHNHLLTEREREILTLLTEGLNSREIAERLVLSVQTIRWYLKVIYSKLDAHSRSEAIARAKELKLLH